MEGKPLRVCPHLRHRRSSIPDACVAPHGVHQRVGGERVVGGPRAHVLLKALNDCPIGPGDHKCHANMKTPVCWESLVIDYVLLLVIVKAQREQLFMTSPFMLLTDFYSSCSLSTQVPNVWYKSQYLPEDIVMSVDLLPSLWILQYPSVPHHSTVDALRFVAAILPVVQHLPVSRRVEDRKSLHQRC